MTDDKHQTVEGLSRFLYTVLVYRDVLMWSSVKMGRCEYKYLGTWQWICVCVCEWGGGVGVSTRGKWQYMWIWTGVMSAF